MIILEVLVELTLTPIKRLYPLKILISNTNGVMQVSSRVACE